MEQPSGFHCFKCQAELSPDATGRREACPKCGSDVRVCRNCTFYDPKVYNECHENQAERVLEKDRSNFCSYFRVRTGKNSSVGSDKDDVLKKLDDLFK